MSTFDALVRSGKVRAVGLSDTPAWYATKAQMVARAKAWEPVAALQLEYSLVELQGSDREHIPAALDLDIGLTPWSPLAQGFLSGKYTRSASGEATGDGRIQALRSTPYGRRYTEQNWTVLDELVAIAGDLQRTPAQIALNWVTHRPGVSSTLIGARHLEQLNDNLGSLDLTLPAEHAERLERAGRPPLHHPYDLHVPDHTRRIHGGANADTHHRRLIPTPAR